MKTHATTASAVPPAESLEGDAADHDLAALCKALGHPVRVRIVRLLSQQARCVCGEIVEQIDLAQSTVSQHLQVLKDAGLVRAEADGARVRYDIEPAALRRMRTLVVSL